LKDISKIYENLVKTDKEKGTNRVPALLELIAGKKQANIAASILQNPEVLENAYNESANNSEGSALSENEKYLDSIEGRANRIKNEITEISANFMKTRDVKLVMSIL